MRRKGGCFGVCYGCTSRCGALQLVVGVSLFRCIKHDGMYVDIKITIAGSSIMINDAAPSQEALSAINVSRSIGSEVTFIDHLLLRESTRSRFLCRRPLRQRLPHRYLLSQLNLALRVGT